ncbi:sensor histidine kinase [Halopseudomonas maritima]|uniref:sensor histidine kinase n=1 Tax=Halopseudomonas maritima TaxID=2918528 RepID=UPI001EE9F82A|nr:ATP-binding protein [Halopseudomonas maritima]UJJ30449.1 CHASE domain-containing protein [Halopseudomonas maritima]
MRMTVPSAYRGLVVILLLVLLLGSLLIELGVRESARLDYERSEHALLSRAADVRSSLETRLYDGIYLSRGLVYYLQSQEGITDPQRIRQWMSSMLADTDYVRNIGVAPDNRIALIYPLAGNEAALGFDYARSPEQWEEVLRMMERREAVLAGPLPLVQGGTGLIHRAPVYLEGSYWGLVSSVMDADVLLGVLDEEPRWRDLRLQLQTREPDGQVRVIWGPALVEGQPSARLDIELPGVVWQLVVQSQTLDSSAGVSRWLLYGGLLLVLALLGFTLGNAIRQQREREAARRENERIKNEFVSTVSHELRTPLTSILGTLGLLDGGALGTLPANGQQLVAVARRNGEHLLRLINDLLDIDKIAAGQLRLNMQTAQLEDLLQAALHEHQGYAAQRQVRWRYQNPYPQAQIVADATRFKQVMDNLLSNAVKFSPQGSEVSVSVTLDERADCWCISVADQGEGIPPAFQNKVFDRFTQADSSSQRRSGGTGLGLAISRGLVERMGGQIGFVSSAAGTRFYLLMPRG